MRRLAADAAAHRARRADETEEQHARRLAADATAHAVARQVPATYTLSAPFDMPTSTYLNNFEHSAHANHANFWARCGIWRFDRWRDADFATMTPDDARELAAAALQDAYPEDADLERAMKDFRERCDPTQPLTACGVCGYQSVPISPAVVAALHRPGAAGGATRPRGGPAAVLAAGQRGRRRRRRRDGRPGPQHCSRRASSARAALGSDAG